jgi:hypothetical protein
VLTGSRIVALGPIQPLTEMSTRNDLGEGEWGGGVQGRPSGHNAICEPII